MLGVLVESMVFASSVDCASPLLRIFKALRLFPFAPTPEPSRECLAEGPRGIVDANAESAYASEIAYLALDDIPALSENTNFLFFFVLFQLLGAS